MSKPFNIHDWQAKQRQQRLTEGKLFEEDFKNPILDKYLKLKKSIDYKTVFPTDLQSFLDSLDNTERKGLKRDLSESLNPEVSRKVDSFIRAMADRYDYTMQDAVYAIMAALKQRNYDGLAEQKDIDNIMRMNPDANRDSLEKLNKMNSQGDMFGRGPAYQELDSGIQYYIDEFIKDIEEGNKKDGTEYLNNLIKAIVALRDSATYEDDLEEANMTGTGASFNAGSGEGYMSPNAFGNDKKKKMKTYKSIGYKKV